MDYVLEQLSMLISSGMGVSSALSALCEEMRSRSMKTLIAGLQGDVEAGAPLWESCRRAHVFPGHIVSLLRIGEESGTLVNNLRIIVLQQEKERIFRDKVQSALLYPSFVVILMLVIGVGMTWFILPKLALVFSQLHIELPLLTRVAIAAGLFLQNYGVIGVPLFVLAVSVFIAVIFYAPRTKGIGHAFLFALPGIGDMIRYEELSRFSYLLGTLLAAGMPIVSCLESIQDATEFSPYKRLYAYLKKRIDEGNSFQKSFSEYRTISALVPPSVRQMIAAGEQSGKLVEALGRISAFYEEKLDMSTKNLASVLEPLLLVCIWVGVVALALTVIVPIYELVGQFNP
jgi:type IV pilus assembly protein PilC